MDTQRGSARVSKYNVLFGQVIWTAARDIQRGSAGVSKYNVLFGQVIWMAFGRQRQQKRKAAEPQNHKAIKCQRSMHQRSRRVWLGGMCGALK